MKVAITSEGQDLSSKIDMRFGRAEQIIVVDIEPDSFDVYSNKVNLNATSGAGIQTAQNVAGFDVQAVITGNIGPNAIKTLNSAEVKVFLCEEMAVKEAVDMFKKGQLKQVANANVEGHWA